MKSRAKRLAESLAKKLYEANRRQFRESSLRWVDDSVISNMASAAKRGDARKFYQALEELGPDFETWMDTVNGSLAEAVKNAMGVSTSSDLYVAMQFLDENGY